MDLSLPGMNGIEATRQIRILSPGSRILFLSEHADSNLIQAALDAGACGYILKSDSGSDLIVGIRAVLLGQLFVSRSLTNWHENSDCMD
jgi:DNA-binding NarL/FixJ family response regulator